MKSQELVQCLKTEEVKDFQSQLKRKGSTQSLLLLTVFRKSKSNKFLSKDDLFTLVFNEKYEKKLDFRLRHVLRNFTEEIEHFIAVFCFHKKTLHDFTINYNPSILLLEFLLERKAFSLFEKEWNKYYKKSVQKKHFKLEQLLISLYFEYVTKNQEEKIKYYDKLNEFLERGIVSEQSEYLEEIRNLEQKLGFIYYTSMFTGHQIEDKKYIDSLEIPKNLLEDDFFIYPGLLAESFYERDHEKRIEIFGKLLKSHKKIADYRPSVAINERDYNNWLGHCYYLKNDYETAAIYFERCIQLMIENPKWLRLELIFNYISILTKLERFFEPILIYEKYKNKIIKNERVKYRFGYLIAVCLIFEGQASDAWALLPKDMHNRPQNDFYYTRFIIVMIYFEENEFELFEREITNIYQTAHYKTPEEVLWLDVSKVFKKMLRIVSLPKPERKKESQKLTLEIEKLDGKYPMFKDILPVKWLLKRISI